MQPGIADVIAVTKTAAQLRAAVFCAGVVIGTLHHIHTPDAVTGLQFFWGKARRRAENAPGGFDENAGNKAVKPRYVQQGGKLFVARSRQVLHIGIKEIFASHAGTFPVYLSVDKDILSKEELDTNWDQGNVRVDELLSLAKDCLAGRKVLAVDLCGEPSANAPEAECSAASLVNQKLYGALAAKIED